jgi:hypothetical protein
MPYYAGIKQIKDEATRHRTIAGLQRLREALSSAIPARLSSSTLLRRRGTYANLTRENTATAQRKPITTSLKF